MSYQNTLIGRATVPLMLLVHHIYSRKTILCFYLFVCLWAVLLNVQCSLRAICMSLDMKVVGSGQTRSECEFI